MYMARHWQRHPDLTVIGRLSGYSCSGMADLLGISLRQLQRHFSDIHGLTIHEWLFDLRMRDAACLLSGSLKIYEVASLLGYKTSSHFHRDFKHYHQVNPSQFTQKHMDTMTSEWFQAQYYELLEGTIAQSTSKVGNSLNARLPASRGSYGRN